MISDIVQAGQILGDVKQINSVKEASGGNY